MITLITGATGSGKSYGAVVQILDALKSNRKVFSNIKLNIEDNNYYYTDEIAMKKFFDEIEVAFTGKNLEDAKVQFMTSKYADALIVLDEVQFLGMRTYNKSVSDWMTLQRHFNQDIILITQVLKNLAPLYQDLCHRHIDYQSSTNRLMSSHLQYTEFDGVKGVKIATRMKKPDKRVFEIYKTGKAESGVHPLMIKLVSVLVLIGGAVSFLIFSDRSVVNIITNPKDKSKITIKDAKVETTIEKRKDDVKVENNDTNITKIEICEVVMETKKKECSDDYVLCITDKDLFTELKKVCHEE